ncbi:MAG: hypothetical protein R3C28_08300 [Pirellulaceae bacterium]
MAFYILSERLAAKDDNGKANQDGKHSVSLNEFAWCDAHKIPVQQPSGERERTAANCDASRIGFDLGGCSTPNDVTRLQCKPKCRRSGYDNCGTTEASQSMAASANQTKEGSDETELRNVASHLR